MKKSVTAAVLGISLIPFNCLGAVSKINDDYKTVVNTVTIAGQADNGDLLAYTVVKKGEIGDEPSKLLSAGDLAVAGEDGRFSLEFIMPEDAPTGDYTLNIGWFGGNEVRSKDIHFINITETAEAVRNAATLENLTEIFGAESVHREPLLQMGYDLEGLNDKIDPTEGKNKVMKSFFYDDMRKGEDIAKSVEAFNKHLGLEFINEAIPGGLDKLNPIFDGEEYIKLTDSARKNYLNNSVYTRAPYDTVDDLYHDYSEINIIYTVNNAAVGEFADKVRDHKKELGIENEDYYVSFLGFSSLKQNKVATLYFEYTTREGAVSCEDFRRLFEQAVIAANTNEESSSGGKRGGSSGTSVSVGTKNDNVNNAENAADFSDLAGVEWAKESINALAAKKIINGTAPGIFEPNSNITREQIVKMILLSVGKEIEDADCPFVDVDSDAWYAPYVKDGYKKGIINGISATEFGTGRNLTRQDLAVIIVRAAQKAGIELSAAEDAGFADGADIAEYAKDAVNILHAMKVINGKEENVFAPADFCTRAEAAKMIYNLFFR